MLWGACMHYEQHTASVQSPQLTAHCRHRINKCGLLCSSLLPTYERLRLTSHWRMHRVTLVSMILPTMALTAFFLLMCHLPTSSMQASGVTLSSCCSHLQIAVPSRTDVPEYQKLRSMVHEIVGRINGAFGTLTYVPIHHLDRQLSFHELCALYAVTGLCVCG